MKGLLRLLQLLSITVWVGGIIFFAFVLAPTAFHTLPTIRLAGLVVGESLRTFDLVALCSGAVFLASTALMFRAAPARIKGRYEAEFLLAAVMVLLTAYIHFNILPAMDRDRAEAGGDIALLAPDAPARAHFDRLHKRSERAEGAVLLLGLAVLFFMSREHVHVD